MSPNLFWHGCYEGQILGPQTGDLENYNYNHVRWLLGGWAMQVVLRGLSQSLWLGLSVYWTVSFASLLSGSVVYIQIWIYLATIINFSHKSLEVL